MSSSSSDNDTEDTGNYYVADSPSKNTRSTSSAGQKKNASLLKALPKAKAKMRLKLPTVAKKTILMKTCKSSSTKGSASSIGKLLNFSAKEDNMLAKAFVNISTNPIHRSGMKSNDFWDNVRQKWIELSEVK
jgi:hypothetical protein